jgi:hypothetical protein
VALANSLARSAEKPPPEPAGLAAALPLPLPLPPPPVPVEVCSSQLATSKSQRPATNHRISVVIPRKREERRSCEIDAPKKVAPGTRYGRYRCSLPGLAGFTAFASPGTVTVHAGGRWAEGEGFEPSVPFSTHDFQSCTFGHSVTPPVGGSARDSLELHGQDEKETGGGGGI